MFRDKHLTLHSYYAVNEPDFIAVTPCHALKVNTDPLLYTWFAKPSLWQNGTVQSAELPYAFVP